LGDAPIANEKNRVAVQARHMGRELIRLTNLGGKIASQGRYAQKTVRP